MAATPEALSTATLDASPRARRVARAFSQAAAAWVVPAFLFLLWAAAAHFEWMPPQVLPAPSLVWQAAVDLATTDLWTNLWISLQRLALGLTAGVVAGLALGILMGSSRIAKQLLYPSFFALIQIPTLAWLPLFMVVLGIGEELKIAVILKAVIVPITIYTMSGLADVQPKLREVTRVLRVPVWLRLRALIVPSALPSFMAGLRLALAQAWISLLVVELLASSEGIGYLMVWGRQLFMLDIVFVCIAVIALFGRLMDRGIERLDRSLIRWPHAATPELTHTGAKGWEKLLPWLVPVGLLVLWQWLSATAQVDANLLPAPSTVIETLLAGLHDRTLLDALLSTSVRAAAGLAVGGTLGVLLGVALGLSRTADRLFGPTFATLRQVAVFAWIPLITAWFGIGEGGKVVFVALAAFFPMFVAAHHGVVNRSAQLDEVARMLRLNARQRLRVLVLPGAASALFSGLHLGLTYAWLSAIGAEYFMRSGEGIGSVLINAQQLALMEVVMSGMVLVGLVGAALRIAGERLEARATRWRTASLRQ
jgi:sulfonate transport system permease protein